MRNRTQPRPIMKYLAACIGVALFFIILFGVGIYRLGWRGSFVRGLSVAIPYPAVLVDWEPIRFYTYVDDFNTLERYWDIQRENSNVFLGIPNSDDIRERLIDKLVNEKLVQIWARAHGVTITADELEREWQRLLSKPEAESEVHYFLSDAYGWSEEKFKQRVLYPFLLQEKVERAAADEQQIDEDTLFARADEVRGLVAEPDADFEALAREYSDDGFSAAHGGDLGYFPRGTFEPQVEEALYRMEIGEISQPIPSSFGYHIIRLDDVLYNDAGVAIQAAAHQILIASFDFEAWLNDQKERTPIYRLVY